jgi:SRF-type transcription factor (DNA-binding and dimerisation domain)
MGRKKIATNERKSFSAAKELFRKRIGTVMKKPKELAELCGVQYFFMIKSMNGNLHMDSSKSLRFLLPKMENASNKAILSPPRLPFYGSHEHKGHSNYGDIDFRIEMPPSESPSLYRGRRRKGYNPPMSSFNNSFNQEQSGVSEAQTPFSAFPLSRHGDEGFTPKKDWLGLFQSEPSAILSRKASGYSSRKASCYSSSSGAGPGVKPHPEASHDFNFIEPKKPKPRNVGFSVKSKKKVRFDDDIDSRYELRSHNRSMRHSAFVSGEISGDHSFFNNSHIFYDSS